MARFAAGETSGSVLAGEDGVSIIGEQAPAR
jgi:hypothetical protein